MGRSYTERFDDGPGGWFGWYDNALGPKPLEVREGWALSRSPWWIDYNHAPPGAGYLHLPYILTTVGKQGEHQREVAGPNRFVEGGYPTRFIGARVTLRLRGEVEMRGARFVLLVQGLHGGVCSGWLLTGRPFAITPEWTEPSVVLAPDKSQWTCLGARVGREDFYGRAPLEAILGNVNVNILLVFFGLDVVPMGPDPSDPHRQRPEKDYPVWRSRLPEGYVLLDTVSIEFAG